MLAAALLVKVTSPGPVLFVQERGGLNARAFRMLKFRTMHADAEAERDRLLDANEMGGPVFKMTDDPRVTRIGRFLRRTSLDELPQLVNVVLGHMSLVGPRPLPLVETRRLTGVHRRRLSVKPGITGLWQVSGRNDLTFEEWMALDLQYIDHWSLGLDLAILLRTVPALLTARGAR
jgi:lipopolysaccharide/colanic/teichoic acid biosynthesis glycosyltransferase